MCALDVRTADLFENPTHRLAAALSLDVSGSMSGKPIEELNRGVGLFYRSVQQHALARHAAEIGVVEFGSGARVVRDFEPVLGATPPQLEISDLYAGTSLGSGVQMALDLLEKRKAEYRRVGTSYHQPWLVIITDGDPTDDSHVDAASRIAQLVDANKLTVFPIGVGGADMSALAMLSPKRAPLRLKGLNFEALFEFLSRSVVAVSTSRPGDSVALPTANISTWAQL